MRLCGIWILHCGLPPCLQAQPSEIFSSKVLLVGAGLNWWAIQKATSFPLVEDSEAGRAAAAAI